MGGDLSEKRLLLAYRQGIFPWFSDEDPIVWWSPDPRLVLLPDEIRVSKSLKKIIKKGIFHVTMDTAFDQVINSCAQVRIQKREGTWIIKEMVDAYVKLHESGYAHSVEAWYEGALAGGLYGVSLGKCFFGESMFYTESNASKIALYVLVEKLKSWNFHFIDAQQKTSHIKSMGANAIPRKKFIKLLEKALTFETHTGKWT